METILTLSTACSTLQEVFKFIIEKLSLLEFEELPLLALLGGRLGGGTLVHGLLAFETGLSVRGTAFGGGTGLERDSLAVSTGLTTVSPLQRRLISAYDFNSHQSRKTYVLITTVTLERESAGAEGIDFETDSAANWEFHLDLLMFMSPVGTFFAIEFLVMRGVNDDAVPARVS
jgi:hypothetical protein